MERLQSLCYMLRGGFGTTATAPVVQLWGEMDKVRNVRTADEHVVFIVYKDVVEEYFVFDNIAVLPSQSASLQFEYCTGVSVRVGNRSCCVPYLQTNRVRQLRAQFPLSCVN